MNYNIDILNFPLDFPEDANAGIMYHLHGFSENDKKLSAFLESGFIGLVFNLQENLHYKIGKAGTGILPRRHYSLAYLPSGGVELSFKKGKYSAFCIEFTPYYLARIRNHFSVLTDFLKNVEAQSLALLCDHRPIPPDLFHEIHLILIDKESTEETHKYLLGSKYVTISMDCLKHLGAFGGLDKTQVEKIRRAHDYITKNFRYPCRVSQIAAIVEMNPRQLENGFKIVYEKTVYKFLTSERMDRATALLRDTNMSIKDIAHAVGYRVQKHSLTSSKGISATLPASCKKRPVNDGRKSVSHRSRTFDVTRMPLWLQVGNR